MKKVLTWKAISFGKVKVLFFLLLFLTGVILIFNFFFLENKIRDLRWENAFLQQKLEETSRTVNLLWEERAFEKEMKENLSYYLPEGYNRKAVFIDLTPLDLESRKARVSFLYDGKTYFVDFSYYRNQKEWQINRGGAVTLTP